jgi:hypothetical protein
MPNSDRPLIAASLPQRFDIDVCLNGGRHHVEALQIIPQAAAIVAAIHPGQTHLSSAAMKHMTKTATSPASSTPIHRTAPYASAPPFLL